MISRISAAVFGATLLVSGVSIAQQASTGPYLGAAVGQSTFWDVDNIEFEYKAFMISGAAGFRLTPNLRAEAEILYEQAPLENSSLDIEVIRGSLGGFFDFSPISMGGYGLSPYFGGGLGIAHVEVIEDEYSFFWHGDVGASVPLGNNLELVPGIRFEYTYLEDGETFVNIDDDLWITQLRVGVRYAF